MQDCPRLPYVMQRERGEEARKEIVWKLKIAKATQADPSLWVREVWVMVCHGGPCSSNFSVREKTLL